MLVARGDVSIDFKQTEVRGVFGVLKKVKAQHAFFLDCQARVFERGFAVCLNHLGLDVVVNLENEHSDTEYVFRKQAH
jgi:hypothetical protein